MRNLKIPAILILCFLTALGISSQAQTGTPTFNLGDVTIAPTRIIFEGAARTAEVSLINQSDATISYSILFQNLRMLENGEVKQIAEPGPGEQFADKLIRFTPRRVVLEPRQTQVVRLQLIKPADLAAGEYRSHMVFQVVPATATESDAAAPEDDKSISIQLVPIFGVSIPIIVRVGATSAKVSIANVALEPASGSATGPSLAFDLVRSGNQSVYGNLEVEFARPGKPALSVGKVNGLAVYTPNARRRVTVPLTIPQGAALKGGTLRIRYTDPVNLKNNVAPLFASISVVLQ